MKKRILNFAVVAAMLFFVACSNEEIIPVTDLETPPERTFSLSATVLEPSTRVQLTTSENFVHVKWKVNDKINLAFVSGSVKKFQEANVDNVSNEGKTAHFDITIPEGLGEEFTLYGVYGGLGIDETTANPVIKLPTYPGNVINNDMVIFFEHEMNASDDHASVIFQHLGALFNVNIINVSSIAAVPDIIKEVRLVGVDSENENWVYGATKDGNFVKGGTYCLVDRELQNINNNTTGNYISFGYGPGGTGNITVTNNMVNFWTWYPLVPNQLWPELKLQLLDENDDIISESTNTIGSRSTPPVAGTSYRFNVEWVGDLSTGTLNFVEP